MNTGIIIKMYCEHCPQILDLQSVFHSAMAACQQRVRDDLKDLTALPRQKTPTLLKKCGPQVWLPVVRLYFDSSGRNS